MDDSWVLWDYENKTYLHGKSLVFRKFPIADGTHGHCELCWDRFSGVLGDLREGYYEPICQCWICPDCYRKFASLFGWTTECKNSGK